MNPDLITEEEVKRRRHHYYELELQQEINEAIEFLKEHGYETIKPNE
jgi:hypothetical protein